MTLRSQIIRDAEAVYLNEDEFAESIVYRQKGKPPVTISALVNREGDPRDLQVWQDGSGSDREVMITISSSDVEQPGVGDCFQISAEVGSTRKETYVVSADRRGGSGFGLIKVRGRIDNRTDIHSSDYRLQRGS